MFINASCFSQTNCVIIIVTRVSPRIDVVDKRVHSVVSKKMECARLEEWKTMSIRKICLDFHTHTLILYFTIYKDISEILTTRYEVGFFPPIIYICGPLSWRFIQKTDHVRIQSWSAKPSKIHTTRSSRRMSTVKFRYSETKSNSLGAIIAITGSTYKYTYVL